MGAWQVVCRACEFTWTLAGNWSEYERQSVESRPCPCCGAYTLTCPEPQRPAARAGKRREPIVTRRAG